MVGYGAHGSPVYGNVRKQTRVHGSMACSKVVNFSTREAAHDTGHVALVPVTDLSGT